MQTCNIDSEDEDTTECCLCIFGTCACDTNERKWRA